MTVWEILSCDVGSDMVSCEVDMLVSSTVSILPSSDTVTASLPLLPAPGVETLEVEWEPVCGDTGIRSCMNPGTLYAHAFELRILVPVRAVNLKSCGRKCPFLPWAMQTLI